MHGELRLPSDGEHAAGKSAVGDGTIEQIVSGLQLRGHFRRRGAQQSSGWRPADAVAALTLSGNGDGNFAANRHLAEYRARDGALGNIVGGKFGEPGRRVAEIAKSDRDCRTRRPRRAFPPRAID